MTKLPGLDFHEIWLRSAAVLPKAPHILRIL